MKSDRRYVTPAALLLATLLCVACNKSKDSSAETEVKPPPATNSAPPSTAEHDSVKTAPAPYDLQLIDTMSQRHRGAIQMGEMAATKANHAELKQFGEKLVTDQERQVTLLKEWRDQWYAGKPDAENRRLDGETKSMAGINTAHMDSLSGDDFDRMFLDMMIPHNQGAIVMAKEAVDRVEHAELGALSQQIIVVSQREIDMMTQWKSTWGWNQ